MPLYLIHTKVWDATQGNTKYEWTACYVFPLRHSESTSDLLPPSISIKASLAHSLQSERKSTLPKPGSHLNYSQCKLVVSSLADTACLIQAVLWTLQP